MVGNGWISARGVVAVLAALVLVGCGGETITESTDGPTTGPSSSAAPAPDDASSTAPDAGSDPVPEGTPECSAVWQDGAKLARTYAGCAEADVFVERDVLPCSSGQRMIRYADEFYGVLGGTIHQAAGPLDQDRDYRAAIRRCRA